MKRYLLAASTAVSVVTFTTLANAADWDLAPAPSVYDWSGVYFGVNAGAAWNGSEVDGSLDCDYTSVTQPDPPAPPLPDDGPDFCDNFNAAGDELRQTVEDSGAVFTGGAMIGANWQWETLVLGLEADVNYADFGAGNSRDYEFLGPNTLGAGPDYIYTNTDLDANWWGTLRARMGLAADNWLFYGTGGMAWGTIDASARVDYCDVSDCTGASWSARGSESDTLVGWTVGAGVEYAWDNWILGAEYLYVDLGNADFDHNYDLNNLTLPAGSVVSGNAEVDYEFSVARVTAKWKF